MSDENFKKLILGVSKLNDISSEEAEKYVTLAGEHPEFTDETWVVVKDKTGEVLTTLQWPADE